VAPAESAKRESNADGQEEDLASYEPHREPTRVWEEVLDRAADRIDVSSMRVWFEGVCAVGMDDEVLTVAVPNTFAEDYIQTRFKDVLDEELRSVLSPTAEIRMVVGKVVEQA
jgi:chromosomal replication initiation ATPase DnaA